MVAVSVSSVITEDTQTRMRDQAAQLVPIHTSQIRKGTLIVGTVLRDITSHPQGKNIVKHVTRDNIDTVLDMGAKTAPQDIIKMIIGRTRVKVVLPITNMVVIAGQIAPTG